MYINIDDMIHYNYLIVGSGLFGATFAYCAKQAGKKCLVIDKRPHLGGNIYCQEVEGDVYKRQGLYTIGIIILLIVVSFVSLHLISICASSLNY